MDRTRNKGFLIAIRRFVRDRRGVSVLEFALILPVMLTLFLGGTEVTQGITIKRKTTIVTRSLADLVAQDFSVNDAEMSAIFNAANAIMAPYPTGPLKIVISSVAIDANNIARVVWSSASGGATALERGDTVTLPDGLNQFPNTQLIWAESQYDYTPTIGYVVSGTLPLKDRIFLRPRLTDKVCRSTGGQDYCDAPTS